MASRCPSAGLGVALTLLVSTGAAFGDDTCYCRNSTGEHVALGKTACLKTNGGMQEARCGMVLNNTAWKFTGKPCPLASNDGEQGKNSRLQKLLPANRNYFASVTVSKSAGSTISSNSQSSE